MGKVYQPEHGLTARLEKHLRRFTNRRDIRFSLDRPIVSLTFDDVPLSAVTHGAKPMHERGWKGTWYISAGLEGITNHHGKQFERADLIWLQSRGHEIACHTFDHVDCTTLSEEALERQIEMNEAALRNMGLRGPFSGFAYPFGEANADLKSICAKHFNEVRGIRDGVHYKRADLNELKACGLYSSTLDKIKQRITGLKNKPGWLILFTHDICEAPSEWGLRPEEFESILQLIEDSGADVMPVARAVSILGGAHYG